MNRLKQFNLLYVEDEKLTRDKFSTILKQLFKNVDVAENGRDALEKYEKVKNSNNIYDLIISDINMPILNGLEFSQKIRDNYEDIPIILLTARNESEYLLKSIELNISDFIIKPIDMGVLVKKCLKIVEKIELKYQLNQKHKEIESMIKIFDEIVGVSKFSKEGNLIYANKKYLELTNYTEDEIIGKNIQDIASSYLSKIAYNNMINSIKNGNEWKGKIKKISKNGLEYYVNKHLIPIYNDCGNSIKEYIAIKIINTEEELQKKHLMKKVSNTILESTDKRVSNESRLNAIIKELKIENDQLKGRNTYLDIELSKLHKANYRLNDELSNTKIDARKNKPIENNNKNIIKNLENELQEANLEISSLKKLIDTNQNKLNDLTKQLEDKEYLLKGYTNKEQALKGNYEESNKDKGNFLSKILKG